MTAVEECSGLSHRFMLRYHTTDVGAGQCIGSTLLRLTYSEQPGQYTVDVLTRLFLTKSGEPPVPSAADAVSAS